MSRYRRLRWLLALATAALGLLLSLSAVPSAKASATTVTLRGTFVVVHADGLGSDSADYWLEVGEEHYQLRFSSRPTFRPNEAVEVEGELAGEDLTVTRAASLGFVASPATTTGNTSVLVILAYWNAPDGVTPERAVTQIGTTDSAWYSEVSYGAITGLTATATQWVKIDDPGSCRYYTIAKHAKKAARSEGYDPGNYDRVMIYFTDPYNYCNWAGLGQIDGRQTWIHGGYMDTRVTVHELGHNYGLYHSHSLTCQVLTPLTKTISQVTLGGACTENEYGDLFDAMGNGFSGVGHFNAAQKDALGWMGARVRTVSGSAAYTLAPLEQSVAVSSGGTIGTFPKSPISWGLRIPTSTRTYWVEFRQRLGVDSWLPPGATNGVLLHVSDAEGGTDLLDGTAGDWSFVNAALPAGASWKTPDGFTLTVESVSSTGARVTVSF